MFNSNLYPTQSYVGIRIALPQYVPESTSFSSMASSYYYATRRHTAQPIAKY